MATVDDRVAALELRVGEQAVMMDGLREAVASLDRRIASLEARMDARFTTIDQRFVAMDDRFTALDTKISRQFLWILGVQMTMFVAMIATLLSAFLMQR